MPKTHPTYDTAFRQGAIDLLLSSGRPLKRVAADLGVSANALRGWRDLALGKGHGAPATAAQPAGRGAAPFADPATEIRRLQREVEYLRRQREILKSHEHSLGRPHERHAMITSMKGAFSISELCAALGVSRSGYHAACTRGPTPRTQANAQLLGRMQAIHSHRHTRGYGSPRMTRELQDTGAACSVNRVARVMRAAGLRVRARSPYRPKTTQPDHAATPSPNLLARADPPTIPGTHLVSDITYIPTKEGWLYLAVTLDLFSRSILGWSVAESLHATLVTEALQRALDGAQVAAGALFHSDRGCQYRAVLTRSCLAHHGLRQSMSAKGYCYDNAFAESCFASLKSELLDEGRPFPSKQAAKTALFDYLACFYNRKRLHSSLGYLSPKNFLDLYFQSQATHLN